MQIRSLDGAMNCLGCPMLRILNDESLKKVDKNKDLLGYYGYSNKQVSFTRSVYINPPKHLIRLHLCLRGLAGNFLFLSSFIYRIQITPAYFCNVDSMTAWIEQL